MFIPFSSQMIMRSVVVGMQNKLDHFLRVGSLFLAYKKGKFYYEDFPFCPLCQSHQLSSYEKQSHLGLPVSLKQCRNCQFIIQSPKMGDASLNIFYEKYYRKHFMSRTQRQRHCETLFERGKRRGKGFFEFIENARVQPYPSVIEIGCSYGGTLSFLKQCGYDILGCDKDPFAISYGVSLGLNLKLGSLHEIRNNKAGLVILSHVLEHVSNPIDFIRDVKNLLLEKGFLLVQVPHFMGKANRSIQVGHLLYFTPETLLFLFDKSDYKRVALEVGRSNITALFTIRI